MKDHRPSLGDSPVMNYLAALLCGMMISVMVVFNGGLNERVGQAGALVLIHTVGLLLMSLVMLVKKDRPRNAGVPWYLFSGGVIGVIITVCNNLAFSYISVSAMMALGLLGESITSALADHFGFLGLTKRPFHTSKVFGMLLTLLGIAIMLDSFQLMPVVVSLLAGVGVVSSRLVNSQLAHRTSTRNATFFNYLVGLTGALLVLTLTGGKLTFPQAISGPFYIYLGGALGVVIVLVTNLVVRKIPSLYMTMTLFVGQVFAGVLLDMLLARSLPQKNILGGLLVLCGLMVNLWLDKRRQERQKQAGASDGV